MEKVKENAQVAAAMSGGLLDSDHDAGRPDPGILRGH
jgi:hypothetical protein